MMLEIARLIGGTSILLLVAALVTWSNVFKTPILKPIRGRTRLSNARAELASQFLVAATGLSAIAAVLAVAHWMFG